MTIHDRMMGAKSEMPFQRYPPPSFCPPNATRSDSQSTYRNWFELNRARHRSVECGKAGIAPAFAREPVGLIAKKLQTVLQLFFVRGSRQDPPVKLNTLASQSLPLINAASQS